MHRVIDVTPVDTRTEIQISIASYHDPPVIGLNGFIDEDHVILMYDIDRPISQLDFDVLEKLPTPSLIMESKKGYHILNFGIYPFMEFLNIGISLRSDLQHLGHSLIKGYPSIRMGKKPRSYDNLDLNFWDYTEPIVTDPDIMISVGHLETYCNLLGIPHMFMDIHKGYNEYLYKCNIPIVVIYR